MPTADWIRPHGPPIVWKTVDVKEKINDGTISPVQLSIQDIPEDRYDEALDHMCDYFIADEVRCKCLKVKDNPIAVNDNRTFWKCVLKQGMSIGAFKLNFNGELGELVAMSLLAVPIDQLKKKMKEVMLNSKSTEMKKIFTLAHEVSEKIDICKIYRVDKYIASMGLSVKPSFRGNKLAVHLLETRKAIGRKYEIRITSATFAGPSSQIQAERAGFETVFTMRYAEILDKNGQPVFPNIEADSFKTMVKQLL